MATTFQVGLEFKAAGLNNIQAFQRQLQGVQGAAAGAQGGMQGAAIGAKGLGAAIGSALGPLAALVAAAGLVKKGLEVAFESNNAEQRLKNITSSAGEFEVAMAMAGQSAVKFGMTQTEATKALGDVYSRLKGVGFGLKETGEIYDGFNVIAKQSGMATEEASGAFFQLSQALGKGKLNGDEFVTVAEKMPQLLDAIATTTGRSRGELSQMAQEGKITSQVLYEALAGAATAADGLNGKLTDQQQAMNDLNRVSNTLLNSIGQVFGPAVTVGAELLAKAGQMLADWWGYLGNVIFPKVSQAIEPVVASLQKAFVEMDFESFRVFMQNVLLKGIENATVALGAMSKVVGWVIDRLAEMSKNPVFQFIAEQVGRLINHLGLAGDKVGDFAQAQKAAGKATAETKNQYSGLPPIIANAKEEAQRLKDAFDQGKVAIESQYAALQANLSLMQQQADNRLSVTQAIEAAEQAINNAQLQGLQSALKVAASNQERLVIAGQIYALEIANAQSVYRATMAQIQAEVDKAQIAKQVAELRAKETEMVVQLAIAQKQATAAHFKALEAARAALQIAESNVDAALQIAAAQQRGAEATYRAAEAAAKANYQANATAEAASKAASATASAAESAGAYATNMERAAKAAQSAASAGGPGTAATPSQGPFRSYSFGAAGKNAWFMKGVIEGMKGVNPKDFGDAMWQFLEKAEAYNRAIASKKLKESKEEWERVLREAYPETSMQREMRERHEAIASGTPMSAGGYASAPTHAFIGEGGEPEYVIPESRMDAAMANYSAGRRGPSVLQPQVSITTGPVTQMAGANYVTQQDLMSATSSAAKQGASMALKMLRTDPGARRAAGVS